MTTSSETPRPNKEMTKIAKYLNVAVQLILLVIAAYIITRTVNDNGVVLFTWHPVLISIGVSRFFSTCVNIINECIRLALLVSHIDDRRYLNDGR